MTEEGFLTAKTGVTLEQLEMFEQMGYEDIPFEAAASKSEIKDKTFLAQLEYAYDAGVDRRFEEQHEQSEDAVEKVFTEEEVKRDVQLFLSPRTPLIVKHISDENPINSHNIDPQTLADGFDDMRDKIIAGDKTYLYDAILSQLGQMQQMSIKVNANLASQTKVDTVMKYANIQLKLMAEQRRTIQTLDDLMTPKKTTFVKEVSQHNHFSEKKSEIENEKQNALETSSQSIDNNTEILEAEYAEK